MRHTLFRNVLLAGLLVLLTTTPAFATKPVVTDTFEDTITDAVLATCGTGDAAFDIIENAVVTGIEKTFYDRDGTPVRSQLHFTYAGTLTNVRTGESFSDRPDPQLYVFDFADETLTVTGLIFSINVPGEGVVALDAGKIVFDAANDFEILFQSGPHHLITDGFEYDFEQVCAALE